MFACTATLQAFLCNEIVGKRGGAQVHCPRKMDKAGAGEAEHGGVFSLHAAETLAPVAGG